MLKRLLLSKPTRENSVEKIELTAEEVHEIADDAVFKYKVIQSLKTLAALPCEDHANKMGRIEKCLEGIKTQVYFQWVVLGVILIVIIKDGIK